MSRICPGSSRAFRPLYRHSGQSHALYLQGSVGTVALSGNTLPALRALGHGAGRFPGPAGPGYDRPALRACAGPTPRRPDRRHVRRQRDACPELPGITIRKSYSLTRVRDTERPVALRTGFSPKGNSTRRLLCEDVSERVCGKCRLTDLPFRGDNPASQAVVLQRFW